MSVKIKCETWKEVLNTLTRTELTDDNISLIISPILRNDKLSFEIETEN